METNKQHLEMIMIIFYKIRLNFVVHTDVKTDKHYLHVLTLARGRCWKMAHSISVGSSVGAIIIVDADC